MAQLKLIDTHCHLQMKAFRNDIDEVIDNAAIEGVKQIINVGFDLESSRKAVELSGRYPFMYAAVGIHPHDASKCNVQTLSELEDLLKEKCVVALGEIGLDFKRDYSTREIQKEVFVEQLSLAKEVNIPVVLHIRDAYIEVFEILEEFNHSKVLLHCFSGNYDDAQKGLGMGCHLAFGGSITYSEKLSFVIESTPLDRLLLETDAPYLSPVPKRGMRNEPAFIKYTALRMAEIKHLHIEEIAKITSSNAEKFFNL